jgi:hypothetical protein
MMSMKTTPAVKAAFDGFDTSVATARLLLQHALDTKETGKGANASGLPHRGSLYDLDGSTFQPPCRFLPEDPIMPTWDKNDQVSQAAARWTVE